MFPNAEIFRGDFYGAHAIIALIGGRDDGADPTTVGARASELAARGVEDRWVTHPCGPAALYVGPLSALAAHLDTAPLNTEDRPVVEFTSARNPARHPGRSDWTAAGKPFLQLSDIIRRSETWRSSRVSLAEQRASAGGYALQAASTHWDAKRPDDAGRALSGVAPASCGSLSPSGSF